MTQMTTNPPQTETPDFLSRPLLAALSIDWEKTLYLTILVLAIVSRFWGLGDRVMSHDESLHTQFSYQFYDGQGFQHTPLMHGPFLFHITAVSYWLFGDNDLTARIPVAILGVILVAMPYFLRNWLGRSGALVTSFIFLISPYLTYYARYIRHDTPVILWALIMFAAILFYLKQRKDSYLWWLAGGMALLFATKEVSFIYIAIFGSFLIIRMLVHLVRADWIRDTLPGLRLPLLLAGVSILLVGAGYLGHTMASRADAEAAATATATEEAEPFAVDPNAAATESAIEPASGPLDLTMRWIEIVGIGLLSVSLWLGARAMKPHIETYAEYDLIILFTSIVLPMASPLLVAIVGWDPRDYSVNTCMLQGQETMSAFQLFFARLTNGACVSSFLSSGMVRVGIFLLITLIVGVLLGLWWNWQRWIVFAAIFHSIFFVLYTSVFTNLPGWTSGMIGSLGYWLEQHDVQRGNQPEFYYLVVVPLYEFLSLIFALLAVRLWTRQQRLNQLVGYWLTLLLLTLLGYSLGNWFFNRFNDPLAEPNNFAGLIVALTILGGGILLWFFWYRRRVIAVQNETAVAHLLHQYADAAALDRLGERLNEDVTALGRTRAERIDALLALYRSNFEKLTGALKQEWASIVSQSHLAADAPAEFPYKTQRHVWPTEFSLNNLIGFVPFVTWWMILTWIAYSVAGEKMPWLSTHFVIPMGILSGWYVQQKLQEAGGVRAVFTRTGWLLLGLSVTLITAVALALGPLLLGQLQFGNQQLSNLNQIGRFFGSLIAAGVIFYFWQQVRARMSLAAGGTLFTLGVFVVLSLLTVRFTYMANFPNADYATEFMVYAHGAPAAKSVVMEQVDELAMRLNGDKTMQVAFGGSGVAWPFTWYLREYPNRNYFGESPSAQLTDYPVVLVGRTQMDAVDNLLRNTHNYTTHTYLWWPMEEYRQISWNAILGNPNVPAEERRGLGNADVRRALWDVFFYRDYTQYQNTFGNALTTGQWPLRDELRLYIRKDVLANLWDYGVGAVNAEGLVDPYAEGELRLSPSLVINESGIPGTEPGQLSAPRNVAVGVDGRLYVADSGNHRIQVFDADGAHVADWGEFGTEPGQLNEPWGLAVDDAFVYVADTWNHRIQKFTLEGELVGIYGSSGAPADAPETNGLGLFFGPRDIILYGDNQLLVTDTGNHRIQVLDRDGNFITQVGSQGNLLGQMYEPVGLATGLNGDVLLADTWNGRVQIFTQDLFPYAEARVNAWGGNSINNKPYIATDRDGRFYVTDPEGYRILIFNAGGDYLGRYGAFGADVNSLGLPNGIALDSEDNIYIADAGNNRILKFDAIFAPPPVVIDPRPEEGEELEPEGEDEAPVDEVDVEPSPTSDQ